MVVMSDDMVHLCSRYDKRRQYFYGDARYFFPASGVDPLDGKWLDRKLKKCWQLANPQVPAGSLPNIRVYSLRHRFASAILNRWMDEGKDLSAMLPYLRSYMGHDSLSDTAYYIHLMPENLIKNPAVDWESLSRVIPEVGGWES